MSYAAGDPPYRAAEPMAPTRGTGLVQLAVCGFCALCLWVAVLIQLLFIVPRFEKIFLDFKMKLPMATEYSVAMSRFAVRFWWFAPTCLIALILLCLVPRAGLSRWAVLILIVLLPLLLNLFIIASLYFPYAELVEGLNGGPKKN